MGGFVMEHVAIDVADPLAVASWWAENLGFEIVRQRKEGDFCTFIADCTGRIAIELYRAPGIQQAPDYFSIDPLTLHIAFRSEDVDSDIERLVAGGATLVSHTRSEGFDGAMLRDPWGIPVQVVRRAVPVTKAL